MAACRAIAEFAYLCSLAFRLLAATCDGDARAALNALELAATACGGGGGGGAAVASSSSSSSSSGGSSSSSGGTKVTAEAIKAALKQTHLLYDRAGDEHYNIIRCVCACMGVVARS